MRKLSLFALFLGGVTVCGIAAAPPRDRGDGPPERRGREAPAPGRRPAGRDDQPPPPPFPPPRFEPGRVLPPHLRDEIDLSEEQEEQLDKLEREVKDRLLKILTAEQKKKLRDLRRHLPGPPGERGPGPRGDGPPDDNHGQPPPERRPRIW